MDVLEYIKQMQKMYGDDVNIGNPQAYGERIGFNDGSGKKPRRAPIKYKSYKTNPDSRVKYKVITPLTEENLKNYKYPQDHKYKVQIPINKKGAVKTISAKTKKELELKIKESPITNRDYREGLIKTTLPEGAIEFDKNRVKISTGIFVGEGRDKSEIFKIQNKDGTNVKYTTTGAGGGKKKLYNSIEDVKKAKLDFIPDELVKVGKPKKIKQNINEITYKNKKTGKIVKYYKPMIGEKKVTIEGKGAETLKEAEEFVKNYFDKNPRKPHKSTAKLEKELKTLFDDSRIKKILRTGRPSAKDLDIVKNILDVTDRQAQGKLAQLADAVDPQGQRTIDGISKIDGKKAKNIFNFHKTKDIAKELEDIELGKAVGEKPLDVFRKDIQGEIPMKGGIKGYSVDEAHARAAAVRLNSKPYSLFGQFVAGDINQGPKQTFDANLSIFEEQVKNAIKNNQDPTEFIKKYNKRATEAENLVNQYKSRNTKKVYFPRITTDSPDIAIKNKAVYKKYKPYFDKNYAQQKYSFVIPKDLQPLPSLAADLKDKNSSTYKNMIKQIKDVGRKFIKNIDQYDEKELFKKLRNNPNFNKIRKLMPRLAFLEDDFTGPGGFPLTAGLDSSIGVQPVEREENFILRNPGTTAAGTTALGTAAAATTPKGRGVLKKIGKGIFDKGIRPFGTRAGGAGLALDQIRSNIQEGENIADAVVDPLVGLELSFPGLFKENLSKITKNPTAQKILNLAIPLGRAARFTTPFGAALGIAGLGVDAYKASRDRLNFLDSLTPDQKTELFKQERQDAVKQNLRGDPNAFDQFSAAGGGLANLTNTIPPESGPMSQGLRSLYNNGRKL